MYMNQNLPLLYVFDAKVAETYLYEDKKQVCNVRN